MFTKGYRVQGLGHLKTQVQLIGICFSNIFTLWILLKIFFFAKKIDISPFFDASGNINIGASIRIGREIWCLPYAGFFLDALASLDLIIVTDSLSNH